MFLFRTVIRFSDNINNKNVIETNNLEMIENAFLKNRFQLIY